MPAAAKTPFSSKNPATLAKSYSALSTVGGNGAIQGGEVVCPLPNADGSQCRKKCVGNFAYRSICEHIRRAHPDNWIPKLPASPETFAKMVGLMPRGPMSNSGIGAPRNRLPPVRKPSKLSKHMDEQQYLDGLSPPSTASESELTLPSLSVATQSAIFQTRFPPAYPGQHEYDHEDYDDEEEMDCEHDLDDEAELHTETETEDDEYSRLHGQYSRVKASRRSRKRQGTFDSTGSSGFGASRWDELIEAATTRAVVENSPGPLSPPPTASAVPTMCPNTPSEESCGASFYSPKVQCSDCRTLVNIHNSYVCTDCVAGFCDECALAAGKRGRCGECRVFGGKFKPLRVVIRT